jgi:hypothetical protein
MSSLAEREQGMNLKPARLAKELNMQTQAQPQTEPRKPHWPACIGVEEAARILGWPAHYFPILIGKGHLKPLGKPVQNSRKWFATTRIEELSRDFEWLDKGVRIVEKHVHDQNAKRRGTVNGSPEAVTASAE